MSRKSPQSHETPLHISLRLAAEPQEAQLEENVSRTLKRSQGLSDDKEEESVSSSGHKFDLARLPWNARKKSRETDSSTFSPTTIGAEARALSVLRTVEILEAIHIDVKQTRANLLISLDAPQFPESQWKKLLNRGTADFDQVLSGIYASTDVGRTTSGKSHLAQNRPRQASDALKLSDNFAR
ncbi:hypothetical protein FISHEDRAFT_69404 [Fistulina hepatica ATCC 64428]|uniref:Uncharacterized protein n=1 Tax=Fistulina hepatica ATCC 64428 TaxID=1128425 RepID=A0A0D7AMZ3_9AGAR|nr:hypothetical protein FISHEDRAFT_69404 [Fistulina hepatica ATCC 64428]